MRCGSSFGLWTVGERRQALPSNGTDRKQSWACSRSKESNVRNALKADMQQCEGSSLDADYMLRGVTEIIL